MLLLQGVNTEIKLTSILKKIKEEPVHVAVDKDAFTEVPYGMEW